MALKILFLVPYPLMESPSQRFRFEQYLAALTQQGYRYQIQSFLNQNNWRLFFKSGNSLKKAQVLCAGIGKRIIILFTSPMYDFVFIHREVTPIGPPIFEWILAKILRRKIIYDFDDAIWLTDRPNESWVLKLAKWRSKVASICRWSYKVSCGNDFLRGYASQFNVNAIYNPTTIDTESVHNPVLYSSPRSGPGKLRIGWTGSHSTLKYLKEIESVLADILREHPNVEFLVIADKSPNLSSNVPFKFVPWRNDTEIEDLLQFDIGIMPLPDDEWAKGKCGFKALQYMALAFPAVASPVGVNTKIISHGVNGFLCSTADEWEHALRTLIIDPELRRKMGIEGRKTVIRHYSVLSNSTNFLSLFA
jgi:glycosyltransferase involved in cell wall biosynthesis